MTLGYSGYVSGLGTPDFFGGRSKDSLVDGGCGALPAGWSFADVGGVPCVSVLIDGAQAAIPGRGCSLASSMATRLVGVMAQVNLSASPSVGFCLVGYPANSVVCLECGTDGKVRIVKLGTSPNRWSGRTALSGWSTDALPIGGTHFHHLAHIHNPLTLGTANIWHTVLMDTIEELSLDIGSELPYSLQLCPNIDNVDADISVRMYDCVGMQGNAAGAPHLTAWPLAKVTAQHPIDEYADVWTGVGSLTDLWDNWNDAAGNDGDTTYNWTNTTNKQQVGLGETAATLSISGETVFTAYGAATRGPVANLVHRTVAGGTKFVASLYTSLSALVGISNPGTTYFGQIESIIRSSGSWAIADVDSIRFGLQTAATDHDYEWRATSIMLQWCTYLTTLPLTTTPTLPAGGFVQTGMF